MTPDLRERLVALINEESCSFSQGDQADSVQLWIDKAGTTLG